MQQTFLKHYSVNNLDFVERLGQHFPKNVGVPACLNGWVSLHCRTI